MKKLVLEDVDSWSVIYFFCRFEKEIVWYGFYFEKFCVVVKNEKYEEVKEFLIMIKLVDFCEFVVIS